jgi:hypothetical protein
MSGAVTSLDVCKPMITQVSHREFDSSECHNVKKQLILPENLNKPFGIN